MRERKGQKVCQEDRLWDIFWNEGVEERGDYGRNEEEDSRRRGGYMQEFLTACSN